MGAVTRRGLEELPGSGLCHGLAGLLITTRLFEHETGDPRWRADRLHLVGSLIERYEPETRLGYVDIERNGAEVDNPGLLSGTAGVVLAVLAATSSQIPTWVRLLSLA
jgi:hypothetical protein